MAKKKTTKPNNDTLAAEVIETHENESILNEPDPPDRGADEIEMDCGEMSVEEPMEIIKETDKTPQRMAKKIPRDEQIKLGKRPFELKIGLKDTKEESEILFKRSSLRRSVKP